MSNKRTRLDVLGACIDCLDWDDVLSKIDLWAMNQESKIVSICNVHSVITTTKNELFKSAINSSDMATPDGAPIAWFLRRLGYKNQKRINGPDLMLKYCQKAQDSGVSIYLYGGENETLEKLQLKLHKMFPRLKISGAYSPPFRSLTAQEELQIVEDINASGAGVVWVSLGCPKQELWMTKHKNKINAVMIGVGAAFDYHAGVINRAPLWMQNIGLEWLQRLFLEPRRLFKRYFFTNTLFIFKTSVFFFKRVLFWRG